MTKKCIYDMNQERISATKQEVTRGDSFLCHEVQRRGNGDCIYLRNPKRTKEFSLTFRRNISY
jgi:hypothetical protein